MIDPITRTKITANDIRRELVSIQKQIDAAGDESVELVFLELKRKREQMLQDMTRRSDSA